VTHVFVDDILAINTPVVPLAESYRVCTSYINVAFVHEQMHIFLQFILYYSTFAKKSGSTFILIRFY